MIMFLSKTLDMSVVAKLSAALKGRLVVNAGEKPYVAVKLIKGDDVLFIMRETLKLMCEEDK
jgi:transcription-repair coupling factor (superfamily II helicase)